MDLKIEGRVAVITGGDSGMGLATARLLASEGVKIVLTDKSDEDLKKAAAEIGGEVLAHTADLTKADEVDGLRRAAVERFGKVDILVNAAGITGPTGDFLTLTDEDWLKTLEIDFMAAVRVCRAFIPEMRKGGWGRVILFSSEDALQPYADELPYCAAKAAALNLSKGLSKAYATDGILVNAVSPAFVASPMTDAMMEKRAKENGSSFDEAVESFLKEERPTLELRRRGEVEEVAAAVAFLCSDLASFVNGTNLRVDGGSVASL